MNHSISPSELRDRIESRDFNRIASYLRTCESVQRMAFLEACIKGDGPVVRMALSTVNSAKEASKLFRIGLESIQTPDSTTTKRWVEFGVKKLGARKTIRAIRDFLESKPHVVDMAVYWLPSMIAKDAPGWMELKELSVAATKAGAIKASMTSTTPDGKVLFHDCYSDYQAPNT